MYLARAGYGSFLELQELDAPVILDMIEMENIRADIEEYEIEQARNGATT